MFSGFLSVNAYAINDTYPVYSLSLNKVYSSYGVDFIRGDDGVYWADFPSSSSSSEIYIRLFDDESESDSYLNFPIIEEYYDYYVYASYAQRTTGGSFMPSSIVFSTGDGRTEYSDQILEQNKYINRFIASNADYGIVQTVFFGKLNIYDSSDKYNKYGAIKFKGDSGTFSGRQYFEFAIIMVPKGNAQTYTDIMNTINYQTHIIGEKLDALDQALEDLRMSNWFDSANEQAILNQMNQDIQNKLEEQYSGDPETEFSVDDVISQHNEKMGVLSFGSDVMLQFLDMFQSANVGTAELTLPGFNITVENVEYSVWPDYSFNFDQLNDWVPALMSVIRVMLPAFVWLMVLRYCIKVFEDNFLAK